MGKCGFEAIHCLRRDTKLRCSSAYELGPYETNLRELVDKGLTEVSVWTYVIELMRREWHLNESNKRGGRETESMQLADRV